MAQDSNDKMAMPAPAPINPDPVPESYNFVYEGKDISSMLAKSQPVLKRKPPVQKGTGIAPPERSKRRPA
jgi:hypothetical protein